MPGWKGFKKKHVTYGVTWGAETELAVKAIGAPMGSWADLISLLSDTLCPFRVQVTPVTALMVRTDWANHSVLITRIFALILSLSYPSAPVWLGLCQGPAHFILIACALSWDWFASLFSSFLHILFSLCRFLLLQYLSVSTPSPHVVVPLSLLWPPISL